MYTVCNIMYGKEEGLRHKSLSSGDNYHICIPHTVRVYIQLIYVTSHQMLLNSDFQNKPLIFILHRNGDIPVTSFCAKEKIYKISNITT